MGSNSLGSFPLVLTKCASLGGADWHFSWTQVPFSFASFFFWSFSFTRFRKLSRLLECLICLIRTLILLARILPLFVYSDANSMLGNTVDSQFCHGNICGAFLFQQYTFLCIAHFSELLEDDSSGRKARLINSLQSKMDKLYTVRKNKTWSWLWLRSWTYCQIQA